MSYGMTKPTMWLCTQGRLWSGWASTQSDQSSLCPQWVAKDPSFLHADSEASDQTGQRPRLIWVFAGRTATLLVLSWGGSNVGRHNKETKETVWHANYGSWHKQTGINRKYGKDQCSCCCLLCCILVCDFDLVCSCYLLIVKHFSTSDMSLTNSP